MERNKLVLHAKHIITKSSCRAAKANNKTVTYMIPFIWNFSFTEKLTYGDRKYNSSCFLVEHRMSLKGNEAIFLIDGNSSYLTGLCDKQVYTFDRTQQTALNICRVQCKLYLNVRKCENSIHIIHNNI